MTPPVMLSPDSGVLGRSTDMTDDSRWCREARELSVLWESFSPARILPSSLVFRFSDLCLEREKKDAILTRVETAALWGLSKRLLSFEGLQQRAQVFETRAS